MTPIPTPSRIASDSEASRSSATTFWLIGRHHVVGQALQGADSFVPVDQDAGRVRRDHHDRQGLAVVRERGQPLPFFARRRAHFEPALEPGA